MSDFIARNKPVWNELEALLARARKSLRRMSPEELARLDVLYRRTTVHLAQVSSRTTDARLIRYLNDLTAAAHSVIYLPPRRSALAGVLTFLVEGFARVIARTWRYQAVSAVLLFGGALVAYYAALSDPVAAYALLPPGDIRMPGSSSEQLEEVLRSGRDQGGGEKFVFASFLFSHNLKVGLLAMGLGVLAAIPTVLLLIYNGMILGAFTATHHQAGIYAEFWAWILPHGVTELGAIVLCGGIGLLLGRAVVSPGLQTRGESLRLAGIEAAKVAAGVAIMLLIAAIVESYLRQSHLSTAGRFLFAGGSALFWAAYITHGFLRERAARREAAADLSDFEADEASQPQGAAAPLPPVDRRDGNQAPRRGFGQRSTLSKSR